MSTDGEDFALSTSDTSSPKSSARKESLGATLVSAGPLGPWTTPMSSASPVSSLSNAAEKRPGALLAPHAVGRPPSGLCPTCGSTADCKPAPMSSPERLSASMSSTSTDPLRNPSPRPVALPPNAATARGGAHWADMPGTRSLGLPGADRGAANTSCSGAAGLTSTEVDRPAAELREGETPSCAGPEGEGGRGGRSPVAAAPRPHAGTGKAGPGAGVASGDADLLRAGTESGRLCMSSVCLRGRPPSLPAGPGVPASWACANLLPPPPPADATDFCSTFWRTFLLSPLSSGTSTVGAGGPCSQPSPLSGLKLDLSGTPVSISRDWSLELERPVAAGSAPSNCSPTPSRFKRGTWGGVREFETGCRAASASGRCTADFGVSWTSGCTGCGAGNGMSAGSEAHSDSCAEGASGFGSSVVPLSAPSPSSC
mmetsp:Transcript_58224/g.155570  ORF Transcript_58224/g.155570 Transcript_58224/m.155570 type:complete len:427 (-) Transcript_58224:674-1954(-)